MSGDGREPRLAAARSVVRRAAPALLAYTVVRATGVLALWAWASAEGRTLDERLCSWDGLWFLGIVEHGYEYGTGHSAMALFPLYPGLVRAVDPLTPLDSCATAIGISWLASLAAAWGLFALGERLHGARAGVLLAALWGILPHAMVESMAYSESLFTAFVAWALVAVLSRRWLTAGVLTALAGLTRSVAVALIAAVCLAALVAMLRRRDRWRPYAALLIAPLGWLAYLGWVASRTGHLDGWYHIQKTDWGSFWDGGAYTYRALVLRLFDHPSDFGFYLVSLVVLAALTLFVLGALDRQPWPLLVFSGLMLVSTLGVAGYYNAKARLLLPAVTLLLPVAAALAKAGWVRACVVIVALAAVSAYYGGYLLLVWPHSP